MKRALGAWHLTAIGVGAIIGAGLFSLTGLVAGESAGPAVILAYVIAAIPAGLTGLCYAELAAMFPNSGSCYTYIRHAAGNFAGWIVGWDLVLEYAVAAATVAASFAGYTNSLLGEFGINLPAELLNGPFGDGVGGPPGIVNLPAVLIILTCSLLLIRGVSESAWVNTVIVAAKLVIIVLFILLGLGSIKAANYVPFIPPHDDATDAFGWSGVLRATSSIFFSYIGFETVSTAAQESRNPRRDMPIGMLASLVICAVLYIAFAAVLVGLVPYPELKGDAAAAETALGQTPFGWAKPVIAIGILAGSATSILTALYGQSRIFAVMAAEGMLPRIFSSIHARWRTPWLSVLLLLVVTGTLAGVVPLQQLGDMCSIGTLLAFGAVAACVIRLRIAEPDVPRPFRVPLSPYLPAFSILMCALLMYYFEWLAWERLIIWLVIGLVVRFLTSIYKARTA
jgi:APA family basic amino acid/polyamine antiporter